MNIITKGRVELLAAEIAVDRLDLASALARHLVESVPFVAHDGEIEAVGWKSRRPTGAFQWAQSVASESAGQLSPAKAQLHHRQQILGRDVSFGVQFF